MTINGYTIIGELTNENSGFSEWGFCYKDGREFFIKKFLSPVYPYNDTKISPKHKEKKIAKCKQFEERLKKMYQMIEEASDGNVVRVEEFFRHGSRYYIITEKVQHSGLTVEQIASMPYEQKKFLCKVVTHSIMKLHEQGFVHADIKPNNVLCKIDPQTGVFTAKVIDFDCGFFGYEPPEPDDELNGDPIYFAPECKQHMFGEEIALSCKIDVFSLGVLFHQYMTGRQPIYDTSEYDYVSEAILDDARVDIDPSIPAEFADVLRRMLIKEPADRIALDEVYDILAYGKHRKEPTKEELPEIYTKFKVYRGNKS